jgi:hypothetical protein
VPTPLGPTDGQVHAKAAIYFILPVLFVPPSSNCDALQRVTGRSSILQVSVILRALGVSTMEPVSTTVAIALAIQAFFEFVTAATRVLSEYRQEEAVEKSRLIKLMRRIGADFHAAVAVTLAIPDFHVLDDAGRRNLFEHWAAVAEHARTLADPGAFTWLHNTNAVEKLREMAGKLEQAVRDDDIVYSATTPSAEQQAARDALAQAQGQIGAAVAALQIV